MQQARDACIFPAGIFLSSQFIPGPAITNHQEHGDMRKEGSNGWDKYARHVF